MYAAFRRAATRVQCSPATVGIGVMFVASALIVTTIYRYRHVILVTLEIAGIVLASLTAAAMLSGITVASVRWYRRAASHRPADLTGPALADIAHARVEENSIDAAPAAPEPVMLVLQVPAGKTLVRGRDS